jgi:hypothetical protein
VLTRLTKEDARLERVKGSTSYVYEKNQEKLELAQEEMARCVMVEDAYEQLLVMEQELEAAGDLQHMRVSEQMHKKTVGADKTQPVPTLDLKAISEAGQKIGGSFRTEYRGKEIEDRGRRLMMKPKSTPTIKRVTSDSIPNPKRIFDPIPEGATKNLLEDVITEEDEEGVEEERDSTTRFLHMMGDTRRNIVIAKESAFPKPADRRGPRPRPSTGGGREHAIGTGPGKQKLRPLSAHVASLASPHASTLSRIASVGNTAAFNDRGKVRRASDHTPAKMQHRSMSAPVLRYEPRSYKERSSKDRRYSKPWLYDEEAGEANRPATATSKASSELRVNEESKQFAFGTRFAAAMAIKNGPKQFSFGTPLYALYRKAEEKKAELSATDTVSVLIGEYDTILKEEAEERGYTVLPSALCSLLSALCSLLSALCSLLSALCSLLSALCSLLSALCSLRSALCSLFFALCPLLSALCFKLSALSCPKSC